MKTLIILLTLLFGHLSPIFGGEKVPLTLEYANTEESRTWGLMGRKTLAKDHGMLFIYDEPQKLNFWMFNCFIDLSIAFLDDNGCIIAIKPLKSFPEKMDPNRPVNSPSDLSLYSPWDPIVLFFQYQSVTSPKKVRYALEMEKGWFEKNGICTGDCLQWQTTKPQAFLIKKSHGIDSSKKL